MKNYRKSLPSPLRYLRPVAPGLRLGQPAAQRHSPGFTLVELLTVIAIIAILAAMLLPALSAVKTAAKKNKAKLEMNAIVTAIEGYDSDYGRFPVSAAAQTAAAAQAAVPTTSVTTPSTGFNGDITYGGYFPDQLNHTNAIGTPMLGTGQGGLTAVSNNCEVIAILMDLTNYPGSGLPTVNMNHVKNPHSNKLLSPTVVSDPTLGGVGPDLVDRDPWGNPYVITMDLNYDEQADDAFYSRHLVSGTSGQPQGLNGLFDNNLATAPDQYQYHGKVMVWSAGPDGKADATKAANVVPNKDNVLSWQ